MRNPLHDSMEAHFTTRKGHIPFWKWTENGQILLGHTGNLNFLIEIANHYFKKNDFNKMSNFPFDHIFGHSLGVWMARFIEKGLTSQLLRELRQELNEIRFFHVLNPAIPSRGEPFSLAPYITWTHFE